MTQIKRLEDACLKYKIQFKSFSLVYYDIALKCDVKRPFKYYLYSSVVM